MRFEAFSPGVSKMDANPEIEREKSMATERAPHPTLGADCYIPMTLWGRDHWSMLLYFRHGEVNNAGFTVRFDPRMRQNRRNFRIMPERTLNGVVMDPGYGSRLVDGTYVPNHDDWCCVQDFARSGLLTCNDEGVEPMEVLHLSPKGEQIVADLESHKANGGSYSTFRLSEAALAS